jgi:hypothetical protein
MRGPVIERVVVGARVGEGAGCSDDGDVCMYEEGRDCRPGAVRSVKLLLTESESLVGRRSG